MCNYEMCTLMMSEVQHDTTSHESAMELDQTGLTCDSSIRIKDVNLQLVCIKSVHDPHHCVALHRDHQTPLPLQTVHYGVLNLHCNYMYVIIAQNN